MPAQPHARAPLRLLALTLGVLLGAGAAPVAGEAWVLRAEPGADVLELRWTDTGGAAQTLVARFPAGSVSTAAPLAFDMNALRKMLVERLRAFAAAQAPLVAVSLTGTKIELSARGEAARPQVEAVQAEQARLYEVILTENGLVRAGPNAVLFDVPRLAVASTGAVRPLVDALGPALPPRAFAARALAMVQAMSYEAVMDDTFAAPLALLRVRRGDCDEKATLFLALVRSAAPTLPLALFTTEGHAFVGLGLPAAAGELTVDVEGVPFVVAEPVGPAVAPIGALSPVSQKALAAGALDVRTVPEGR